MTGERRDIELRLDQALRDLLELEGQVGDGELSPEVEARLRRNYEREAAEAMAELHSSPTRADRERSTPPVVRLPTGSRRPLSRALLYGAGVLALVAAGLLLPTSVLSRPIGGFVTGNEALQTSDGAGGSTMAGRNLADVSDRELEAVVAANPGVIGMRIALADRYTAKGRYDLAAVHYRLVLEQDPNSAEGMAHIGWLMLQIGKPTEASRLVDRALAVDPKLLDALWFKANIELYGLGKAKAALQTLDVMSNRTDVNAEVREQVKRLRRDAAQRIARR